jgi:hypothetical protein
MPALSKTASRSARTSISGSPGSAGGAAGVHPDRRTASAIAAIAPPAEREEVWVRAPSVVVMMRGVRGRPGSRAPPSR